jgi:hypothetical protein
MKRKSNASQALVRPVFYLMSAEALLSDVFNSDDNARVLLSQGPIVSYYSHLYSAGNKILKVAPSPGAPSAQMWPL